MPKFIIIEPCVEGWTGHYYEYATRVAKQAVAQGLQTFIAVNQQFKDTENQTLNFVQTYKFGQRLIREDSIWRKFKSKPISNAKPTLCPTNKSWLKSFIKKFLTLFKILSFRVDTLKLINRLAIDEKDILFIPTATETELAAVIAILKKSKKTNYQFHLIFHSDLYTNQLSALLASVKNLKINLYTDTKQLTSLYNALGQAEFQTVPIPINENFQAKRAHVADQPYIVRYLGDARTEKGFHHLPALIAAFEKEVLAGQVKFIIQCNLNIAEGEPESLMALEKIGTTYAHLVTLIKKPLNPAEYQAQLINTDVIVLPYDKQAYAARSSGIFTEAITAGIPVIVSSGTWMAEQLACYQTSESLSKAGVVIETNLNDALKSLLADYAQYEKNAQEVSQQWRRYHNAKTLLGELV